MVHGIFTVIARVKAKQEEDEEFLLEDVTEIKTISRENVLTGVSHIYGSANRAAHNLAQFVMHSCRTIVWT